MNREVAVKISTGAFSGRFAWEVHTIAALSHPNVCTLHDVGPDYLVMELVDGQRIVFDAKSHGHPLELPRSKSVTR